MTAHVKYADYWCRIQSFSIPLPALHKVSYDARRLGMYDSSTCSLVGTGSRCAPKQQRFSCGIGAKDVDHVVVGASETTNGPTNVLIMLP